MSMSQMVKFENLTPGRFYIPVFARIEPLNEFGNIHDQYRFDSPFYKYLGGREFEDESGESVDGFFDPELQLMVAPDAPDGFVA